MAGGRDGEYQCACGYPAYLDSATMAAWILLVSICDSATFTLCWTDWPGARMSCSGTTVSVGSIHARRAWYTVTRFVVSNTEVSRSLPFAG